MRVRVRLREQTAVVAIAILFVLILVGVNTVWPEGFTVVIAIGGTLGALVVLYEVRLTQQIAQAEFIRDLQTSFSSDPNIALLWRKLLLGEDITPEDRPLMSSYLTFFETVHLLHSRGALNLTLTDDLFRNRFFTAIGHPVILRQTLLKSVGAFTNIHQLIADWHAHLVAARKPIHPGYYAYVEGVAEAKGFELRRLEPADLEGLLQLQRAVLTGLGDRPWLRANSREMLADCLTQPRHHTLGAFRGDRLVAAAILYDAGTSDENLKRYLTKDADELDRVVNLKLVLADPQHRRAGLGKTLVELLEREAYVRGKAQVLCTIHADNGPSIRLFRRLGFTRRKKVRTKYGPRLVFAHDLHTVDAHWIR
jgi:ribosomal protein S18 acetylase RimI-like enzyme